VLTTCQPSTVWCSRERLPAAAAQPAQGSSEPVVPRIYLFNLEEHVLIYGERTTQDAVAKYNLTGRESLSQIFVYL
jgi:hypothetical protein